LEWETKDRPKTNAPSQQKFEVRKQKSKAKNGRNVRKTNSIIDNRKRSGIGVGLQEIFQS